MSPRIHELRETLARMTAAARDGGPRPVARRHEVEHLGILRGAGNPERDDHARVFVRPVPREMSSSDADVFLGVLRGSGEDPLKFSVVVGDVHPRYGRVEITRDAVEGFTPACVLLSAVQYQTVRFSGQYHTARFACDAVDGSVLGVFGMFPKDLTALAFGITTPLACRWDDGNPKDGGECVVYTGGVARGIDDLLVSHEPKPRPAESSSPPGGEDTLTLVMKGGEGVFHILSRARGERAWTTRLGPSEHEALWDATVEELEKLHGSGGFTVPEGGAVLRVTAAGERGCERRFSEPPERPTETTFTLVTGRR